MRIPRGRNPVWLLALLAFIGPLTAAADLPAGEAGARDRLNASPRHGEWVDVDAGKDGKLRSWIVYPERKDAAPVVVVIHEIYGLTDWIRGVADQLAAEGFIAIAPDLISGKGPDGGGTESVDRDGAVRLIRELDADEVTRKLDAVAAYATGLPAAKKSWATIGFCWGGGTSFRYATQQGRLAGAVVYYGRAPETATLSKVRAPVLGLYGGDDARVNASIPEAEAEMKRLSKRYEPNVYDGAGHGFLRAQDGRDGANLRAAAQAWPRTIEFLNEVFAAPAERKGP